MLDAVSSALSILLTMIGSVISAITGSSGALNAFLPLIGIGIAVSVVLLVSKLIKTFCWGA